MSQYYLARSFENGHGVEKDVIQAFYWYHKSGDNACSVAQHYLGLAYQRGYYEIEEDYKQAIY